MREKLGICLSGPTLYHLELYCPLSFSWNFHDFNTLGLNKIPLHICNKYELFDYLVVIWWTSTLILFPDYSQKDSNEHGSAGISGVDYRVLWQCYSLSYSVLILGFCPLPTVVTSPISTLINCEYRHFSPDLPCPLLSFPWRLRIFLELELTLHFIICFLSGSSGYYHFVWYLLFVCIHLSDIYIRQRFSPILQVAASFGWQFPLLYACLLISCSLIVD